MDAEHESACRWQKQLPSVLDPRAASPLPGSSMISVGSRFLDHVPPRVMILDPGSWTRAPGSRLGTGSWMQGPGSLVGCLAC